jgi:hypothetical protein
MSKCVIRQFIARNKKLKMLGMTYLEYLNSPQWKMIRKEAYSRPQFQKCSICGSVEHLNLHHVKYGKINKNSFASLNTLVSLCQTCHYRVHEHCSKTGASLGSGVRYIRKHFKKEVGKVIRSKLFNS